MTNETRFTFHLATRLGPLSITASASGLHRLAFDDEAGSTAQPTQPPPRARTEIPALREWTAKLVRLCEGCAEDPGTIPLVLAGTAFQQRVWSALRAIPRGETRSYGAIARALGLPGGARAVARACRDNPIALLVPCHRVIAADGTLGGYRWGLRRKARLLAFERDPAAGELPLDSRRDRATRVASASAPGVRAEGPGEALC